MVESFDLDKETDYGLSEPEEELSHTSHCTIMASMTMAALFFGGAMTKSPSSSAPRRSLIVAKAAEGERVNVEAIKSSKKEEGGNSGRRDLVFAGAAVAACSIAKIAFAEDEPKAGTPEAKKKYNAVCVTMPTARICRK